MQEFSKAMGFLVLMKTLSVLALSDPQMFTLVRLVIDDCFAIAQVPVGQLKTQGDASFRRSKAHEAFRRAKDAYASESLKGSDLKDIIEQTKATVIGAEIDSLVSAFCFRRCAMCLLSRVFRPNIQCFGL